MSTIFKKILADFDFHIKIKLGSFKNYIFKIQRFLSIFFLAIELQKWFEKGFLDISVPMVMELHGVVGKL